MFSNFSTLLQKKLKCCSEKSTKFSRNHLMEPYFSKIACQLIYRILAQTVASEIFLNNTGTRTMKLTSVPITCSSPTLNKISMWFNNYYFANYPRCWGKNVFLLIWSSHSIALLKPFSWSVSVKLQILYWKGWHCRFQWKSISQKLYINNLQMPK